MSTIIKHTEGNSHWYSVTGDPVYELPKADGKGKKNPTLADAKKLNLLPGVSKIMSVLDKPAVNTWKIGCGVEACLTAPRLPGEALDAFVDRVLNVEKQHEEEMQIARDFGTAVHDAIQEALLGRPFPQELNSYVLPSIEAAQTFGRIVATEKIVTGDGYAGKLDLLLEDYPLSYTVVDFKTTKKLPKDSYIEHKLQLAAYAKALKWEPGASPRIRTVNIYISKTEPGKIAVCSNEDWHQTYELGFKPLVNYWQWANSFKPIQ